MGRQKFFLGGTNGIVLDVLDSWFQSFVELVVHDH